MHALDAKYYKRLTALHNMVRHLQTEKEESESEATIFCLEDSDVLRCRINDFPFKVRHDVILKYLTITKLRWLAVS